MNNLEQQTEETHIPNEETETEAAEIAASCWDETDSTQSTEKSIGQPSPEAVKRLENAVKGLTDGKFNADCVELLTRAVSGGPGGMKAALNVLNKRLEQAGSKIRVEGMGHFDRDGSLKTAVFFLSKNGEPFGKMLELNGNGNDRSHSASSEGAYKLPNLMYTDKSAQNEKTRDDSRSTASAASETGPVTDGKIRPDSPTKTGPIANGRIQPWEAGLAPAGTGPVTDGKIRPDSPTKTGPIADGRIQPWEAGLAPAGTGPVTDGKIRPDSPTKTGPIVDGRIQPWEAGLAPAETGPVTGIGRIQQSESGSPAETGPTTGIGRIQQSEAGSLIKKINPDSPSEHGRMERPDDSGKRWQSELKLEHMSPAEKFAFKAIVEELNGARDAFKLRELFQILAEDTEASKNILKHLKRELESNYPGLTVNWETGKDETGKPFIHMVMHDTVRNVWDQKPTTWLYIGSDYVRAYQDPGNGRIDMKKALDILLPRPKYDVNPIRVA